MRANEILETCLYVDDLDKAEHFYTNVLGLKLFERHPTRHLFLACGLRMLLLFRPDASNAANSKLPPHGSQGAGHVAFAVPDRDIPAWETYLSEQGVDVERTIAWPQGGHSVYFRDPAGNSLEVASPRIWCLDESKTISQTDPIAD